MDNNPVVMPWRGGPPRFIGRWVMGQPVGNASFERLPKIPPLGEARTPAERLDILTAGKGLGAKPRFLFDSWAEARGALNTFALTDRRLQAAGFNNQALRDALWREQGGGRDALAVLREAAGVGFDAFEYVQKNTAKLGSEFFEPPEQDVGERAAFDVAIAQKYAALPLNERVQWRLRDDPRILAALTRAPRAISEITDAELDAMRERHLAAHFPHSAAAFEALEACIDPPRRCVVEGLGMISTACGRTVAELTAGWGDSAAWITSGA